MTETSTAAQTEKPTTLNLNQLVVLRSLVILAQIIAVFTATLYFHVELAIFSILSIISLFVLINLFTHIKLKQGLQATDRVIFLQLLFDVIALSVLLYLTGGSSNPFVSFLLIPLAISAAVLPARYSWLMTGCAVTSYTLLMIYFVPLSHHNEHDFKLHIIGMWVGFLISATLITYFVTKMGKTLREQERSLANAREQALKDDRLVALGTLAAGAAHEFGTPLGTMAILLHELQLNKEMPAKISSQLDILETQIDRCKEILTNLSTSAGHLRADTGRKVKLDEYISKLLTDWKNENTNIQLDIKKQGEAELNIVADQTLTQAVNNILSNAVDAKADTIRIKYSWDKSLFTLDIEDNGEGLNKEAEKHAGEPFFTTKAPNKGMGLGLYLAKASLSRYGGELKLQNNNEGGVKVNLSLPLEKLLC